MLFFFFFFIVYMIFYNSFNKQTLPKYETNSARSPHIVHDTHFIYEIKSYELFCTWCPLNICCISPNHTSRLVQTNSIAPFNTCMFCLLWKKKVILKKIVVPFYVWTLAICQLQPENHPADAQRIWCAHIYIPRIFLLTCTTLTFSISQN